MQRAHRRGAATDSQFYFRKRIDYTPAPKEDCNQCQDPETAERRSPCDCDEADGVVELTVQEILEGKASVVKGR
ncbi:unnamed protein product [Discosporangium mesarthrocarpum]